MQITERPHLTILEFDPDTCILKSTCPLCGHDRVLEPLDFNKLHAWVTGTTLVQRAFPDLNESDREALVTGICDTCWQEDEG